jgi:hypothetical protein
VLWWTLAVEQLYWKGVDDVKAKRLQMMRQSGCDLLPGYERLLLLLILLLILLLKMLLRLHDHQATI